MSNDEFFIAWFDPKNSKVKKYINTNVSVIYDTTNTNEFSENFKQFIEQIINSTNDKFKYIDANYLYTTPQNLTLTPSQSERNNANNTTLKKISVSVTSTENKKGDTYYLIIGNKDTANNNNKDIFIDEIIYKKINIENYTYFKNLMKDINSDETIHTYKDDKIVDALKKSAVQGLNATAYPFKKGYKGVTTGVKNLGYLPGYARSKLDVGYNENIKNKRSTFSNYKEYKKSLKQPRPNLNPDASSQLTPSAPPIQLDNNGSTGGTKKRTHKKTKKINTRSYRKSKKSKK